MDSEKTGAGVIGAGVVGLACARTRAPQGIETILLERHDDFGPDVEWIDSVDYSVDPRRADRFYVEVRKYWPALPDDSLLPAYRGIRPKISGPGAPAEDFLIRGAESHGIVGLVNLFGIESPGLTPPAWQSPHIQSPA